MSIRASVRPALRVHDQPTSELSDHCSAIWHPVIIWLMELFLLCFTFIPLDVLALRLQIISFFLEDSSLRSTLCGLAGKLLDNCSTSYLASSNSRVDLAVYVLH